MTINYRFIETHNSLFFATISKEYIDDPGLEYVFPMNYERDTCYKINRKRLKSLVDDGTLSYNYTVDGAAYIKEKQYRNYFDKITIDAANKLVENK